MKTDELIYKNLGPMKYKSTQTLFICEAIISYFINRLLISKYYLKNKIILIDLS